MRTGIEPKVDYVFKKTFGSEERALVLVSLLNAFDPAPPVTGVRIVVPYTDKASAEDKSAIADVKAVDQGNRQFHLEMQWQTPWFFPKRVLFYWGKFHPQQLREGEHYLTLRPTISICFTNLEVLTMFTQDEVEREKYELRLMYQRDHASLVADAEDRGARNVLVTQIRKFQQLLGQPTTPQAELLGLPIENLNTLLDQLQTQLLSKGS